MIAIELEPVDYYCGFCESAMEPTWCMSPHCAGYRCLNCLAGCDLEALDDGECAAAIAGMSYAQRAAQHEERRLAQQHRRPMRTVNLPEPT